MGLQWRMVQLRGAASGTAPALARHARLLLQVVVVGGGVVWGTSASAQQPPAAAAPSAAASVGVEAIVGSERVAAGSGTAELQGR